MGLFLNPDDFTSIADAALLIDEAESAALREVPVLGTLQPSDPPVPPQHLSYWAQVGTVLTRVVKEWAAQGWEGTRSQTIGPFTKTWWSKAGKLDLTALRRIGQLAQGEQTIGVSPRYAMPPTRPLGHLFNGGQRVG
jgi:hypothetical protein